MGCQHSSLTQEQLARERALDLAEQLRREAGGANYAKNAGVCCRRTGEPARSAIFLSDVDVNADLPEEKPKGQRSQRQARGPGYCVNCKAEEYLCQSCQFIRCPTCEQRKYEIRALNKTVCHNCFIREMVKPAKLEKTERSGCQQCYQDKYTCAVCDATRCPKCEMEPVDLKTMGVRLCQQCFMKYRQTVERGASKSKSKSVEPALQAPARPRPVRRGRGGRSTTDEPPPRPDDSPPEVHSSLHAEHPVSSSSSDLSPDLIPRVRWEDLQPHSKTVAGVSSAPHQSAFNGLAARAKNTSTATQPGHLSSGVRNSDPTRPLSANGRTNVPSSVNGSATGGNRESFPDTADAGPCIQPSSSLSDSLPDLYGRATSQRATGAGVGGVGGTNQGASSLSDSLSDLYVRATSQRATGDRGGAGAGGVGGTNQGASFVTYLAT